MTSEAPPQLPTPELITHPNNYVDIDSTVQESAPETNGTTYKDKIAKCELYNQATGQADQAAKAKNLYTDSTSPAMLDPTQAVMDTVQNSSLAQNAVNGPVGQSVKAETRKTTDEFRDLADARRVPDQRAVTGQPLTHYHSMFYRLLSWRNPRATSISFACTVLLIFAARYVNIVRYIFKILWTVLGCTVFAEVAGRAALGHGLATQMRPRQYYMIRKESLERLTDDLEQLINFFVIEMQRVVFVENTHISIACLFASVISYWLIKWLPLWGLSLIATVLVYMCPLVYIHNKEYIDEQLHLTNQMLSEQTKQFKELACQHSARAQKQFKIYADEYSHKAQEMMGQARSKAFPAKPQTTSSATPTRADNAPLPEMAQEQKDLDEADFPKAPKEDLPAHAQVHDSSEDLIDTRVPEPVI